MHLRRFPISGAAELKKKGTTGWFERRLQLSVCLIYSCQTWRQISGDRMWKGGLFFFFSQEAELIKHLTTRECVSHSICFQYCCPECSPPPTHPALVHLPRFKGLDRGLYFPWSYRPLNLALLWRPFFPLRLTRKCTHLPDLLWDCKPDPLSDKCEYSAGEYLLEDI